MDFWIKRRRLWLEVRGNALGDERSERASELLEGQTARRLIRRESTAADYQPKLHVIMEDRMRNGPL